METNKKYFLEIVRREDFIYIFYNYSTIILEKEEYNIFNYFNQMLNEYTQKLATVGLSEEDYPEIIALINQIRPYCFEVGYRLRQLVRMSKPSASDEEK